MIEHFERTERARNPLEPQETAEAAHKSSAAGYITHACGMAAAHHNRPPTPPQTQPER